jgi:DNA-binding Lrp family transcriptional regulator
LDALDIQILRELTQGHTLWPARPGLATSYRAIARTLRASPGTVRNHIARMIESGFLQGISVYPNPTLLGLHAGSYAVETSPTRSKDETIDRLSRIDDVLFLEDFRGPLIGMGLAYPDEPSLRITLRKIDQITGSHPGMFSAVAHPPAPELLSRLQWKLVARLTDSRFRRYSTLARELGVSSRVLRRRLARLVGSGALLSFPKMDYGALSGVVTAELLVSFGDPSLRPAAERAILDAVDPWMTFAGVWERFSIYRLLLPNVARLTLLSRAIEKLGGVAFVRGEFVEGLVYHFDKLHRLAEHKATSPNLEIKGGLVAPARATSPRR